jgi:hypothetical protein
VAFPAFAAGTVCDHPYFPLKEGRQVTFASSAEGNQAPKAMSMTVTKMGAGRATIESVNPAEKDKPPFTLEIACSSEGVEFDLSKMSGGRTGIKMDVLKRTGFDFPAASRFKPAESWETDQTVQVATAKQTLTVETKAVHKVIGTERVTVPAGSFDAVKIQVEADTATTGSGMQIPPMHISQTYWVAKGVGIVKFVIGKRTTELLSYSH